ncbi:hypothetical protein EGM88_13920 [Aureibaculum marinum]|uniref:Glycoside hydrolase family 42 N-terminal domain-containing protein n=1 Tax=Aureibaculum marinum TaxID=2487930 RepID=A0A3N4P0Y5_9FLAO|nr:hypothetical protein [Aureibaculum marinum]RPD93043.1 hypothetical protein EGM88_13920 [Aureibaculum marinum]
MNKFFFFLILVSIQSCSTSNNHIELENNTPIYKPTGLYTSSFGNETALAHPQAKGSLIRVTWKDLEPAKGLYDFTALEEKISIVKSYNKKWSLAIIAGNDSPEWLLTDIKADFFEIVDINNTLKKIPKIWDPKVNERLDLLARQLAETYNNDIDLTLVYVPQMTVNGIEGHFNGVTSSELINAGLTANRWVSSVKETAKIFANYFSNKAIAVEVHDIMGDTSIPNRIINDLWNDYSLNKRVGAAIWWISGKNSYQPNLIDALTDFEGDIYAQAIGRSDQIERFENNDYRTLFSQSETIGVRYLELWEYEFVNNTFPTTFESFNKYTDSNFNKLKK